MKQEKHLTPDGLKSIINIRASMNRGLTLGLIETFPYYIPEARRLIFVNKSLFYILIE